MDEAADGSYACACGHGYEGARGVEGAVDGGEDGLDGDG